MGGLYWGDFGGVWWGSLPLLFPGNGGGEEAHRRRGASRGVRPGKGCAVSLGGLLVVEEEVVAEEEVVVEVGVSPPPAEAGWGPSGHFRSSPLGLGSFEEGCDEESLIL